MAGELGEVLTVQYLTTLWGECGPSSNLIMSLATRHYFILYRLEEITVFLGLALLPRTTHLTTPALS